MNRKMNSLLMAALMMGAATLDTPNRNYSKSYIQNRPTPKPEVEPRHYSNPHLHEYNINGTIITAKNKKDARRIYQSRNK